MCVNECWCGFAADAGQQYDLVLLLFARFVILEGIAADSFFYAGWYATAIESTIFVSLESVRRLRDLTNCKWHTSREKIGYWVEDMYADRRQRLNTRVEMGYNMAFRIRQVINVQYRSSGWYTRRPGSRNKLLYLYSSPRGFFVTTSCEKLKDP